MHVYGLQGGGLGRMEGKTLVFFEVPDWGKNLYNPGDEVPREWDYQGPFLYTKDSDNYPQDAEALDAETLADELD